VAMGGAKLKPKGVEHTLSLCGAPEQSIQLRDRLDALIAKGEGKIAVGFGGNPKDSSAVRGGPAFEFIFNVHKLLEDKGLRDKFELTFFAPMPKPGIRMGEEAYAAVEGMFERLDIHKRFGVPIAGFEPEGVRFGDGSLLESDLVMFIPAGTGHPVVVKSGLPLNEAGFIRINDYCEVDHNFYESPDKYPIFAVGDVAALDGPDWRAKQGHVAEVMARVAADNIIHMINGRADREGYEAHVNIMCVMDTGDGAAFVYRDNHKASMIPLPWVGHWLKKGWGWYWRNSKQGKIPRLPGM
jgi:sulfide:quinone oxidoreductase